MHVITISIFSTKLPNMRTNIAIRVIATFLIIYSSIAQASFRYAQDNTTYYPVVIWHGMGDTCCNPSGLGKLKSLIEEQLGVFVYSVALGSNAVADALSGYYGNVNDQVAQVCAKLRNIPQLADGYNAVGVSQGSQFLRAVVERCQHTAPKMHTLVSLGGQHQGVSSPPGCIEPPEPPSTAPAAWSAPPISSTFWCRWMQRAIGKGVYLPWLQETVVQAQYYKDPAQLQLYLQRSAFLADVNNDRAEKNPQYAANLRTLDRLVLVRFEDDSMVVPRDSAWFSYYNGTQLLGLREQPLYQEDWIGLRALDERGAIDFVSLPGNHLQFTLKWFQDVLVGQWLAAPRNSTRQQR